MAATTTYSQMYAQFKRDIGLDENFGDNADLAAKFNGWFNDRLREIWRAADWPQCTATEGFAVCTDGVVPLPSVVDAGDKIRLFDGDARAKFNAQIQQFILNDGWLWVPEKKASAMFALGEAQKAAIADPNGMCFMRADGSVYRADSENGDIDLSGRLFSNCRDAVVRKGDVYIERAWGANMAYVLRAYLYAADEEAAVPEGSHVGDYSSVWLDLPAIPFKPSVWLRYKAVAPFFGTDGVDTVTTLRLDIPLFMKRYVQLAVHSDWLRSVNRQEESESVARTAERVKDEEIYRHEMFSINVAGDSYANS